MAEPHVPLPPPDPYDYWDPQPARCPDCRAILQNLRPSPYGRGNEGSCPEHGLVIAAYFTSDLRSEIER